ATEQHASQGRWVRPVFPLVEHALEHVRDDADDRDAFVLDGRIDARWIEGLVDDGGRTVDRAAEQDREAPNVKQRQAREPTVVLPYAEIEGGTDGAPEVVSVGQHRPLWRARGAGGVDEGV